MSIEEFKQNWPTPAETMAKVHKIGPLSPSSEDKKKSQQLQSQAGSSTHNISFLQPSVVYPSLQIEGGLHQLLDISVPNPNIHIWSGTLKESVEVGNNMHPAILSQLKPCITKGDDNCLYNAICLCLGLPESQQNVLRKKTALCLLKHSDHFTELLKASDEVSLQTLIDQCQRPFEFEGWGNEFHILALAILLKRNIIVYTTFKSPKGQFYQRKNKNIVGLAEEFKIGGEKIEQHMNFQPQRGITCHNPIFIHLNGPHFTALVPRLPDPVYCVPPATNLPSITNNGILSHVQDSQRDCQKRTRKARWKASKTSAELAEYKARKKSKRKKSNHGSDNSEDTTVSQVSNLNYRPGDNVLGSVRPSVRQRSHG